MELKMEAAKRRKSVAAVARERLAGKKGEKSKRSTSAFFAKLDKLAKSIAKQNPGVSLSKKLIEMRYEQ